MPIECSLPMRCFGQEEFHDVDHCVTGLSFEVHNDLGRFFDERVYRDALANRCEEAGFSARREVVVRVSHKDFVKDYYLDLVIADGVLYELKTSDALVPTHEKQLINYLLLTDQRHGALLNFRTASVQKRFVSTTLTREKRQDVNIKREQWDSSGPDSRRCLEILAELLADWGAFLDVGLYHEAVLHNLGGGRKLECVTKVETGNGPAIPYRFHILDGKAILHVSAATRYQIGRASCRERVYTKV